MFSVSPTVALCWAMLLLGCFLFYRAAVPTPLRGIPYVKASANRMFGDLPAALMHQKKTGLLFTYISDKCVELNEPLVQFFFRPFSQPWVAICDGREAQDIMTHRAREFDRSPLSGDLVRAHLPNSQLSMFSNEQWRFNRLLVRDTMSPKFLSSVVAPTSYDAANDLISLWKQKVRLAGDGTLDVKEDLLMAVVDVIWAATFGSDIKTCKSQVEYLSGITRINQLDDDTNITELPSCDPPAAYKALTTLFDSSQIALKSSFGYRHHWLAMKLMPYLRRSMKVRDTLVRQRIQAVYKKFADNKSSRTSAVRSAVDCVVEREVAAALKEGRQPMQPSITKYIHDELCLFLSAGSTTTAESICWGLKYLTVHQDIQRKIRSNMKAALKDAAASGTKPTAEAITKAENPYLEAFMNETLRHGTNIEAHMRVAQVDTQVLGYPIPKGTQVILVVQGPSLKSPAMPIHESRRSQTSQASPKHSLEKWSQTDLEQFIPERWLFQNEKGETKFNPSAAPMQTFGAGPRACFGQKFAYLEMRIIYTLILWNFELLPIHPSLMDFQGVEVLSLQPKSVRVRLRELK